MSYLGFTGIMSAYCSLIKDPWVLEIGVDRGQTALPLLHNLTVMSRPFKWIGVDVRMDGCLMEQLRHMAGLVHHSDVQAEQLIQEESTRWNTAYVHDNSLKALPLFVEQGWKFDLVLIDGDHNYATVTEELAYLKALTHPSSLIFMDDYCNKWKDLDHHYKEEPTHRDNPLLYKLDPIDGKEGVNQAVDDWIEENPDWECTSLVDCALVKQKEVVADIVLGKSQSLWQAGLCYRVPPSTNWRSRLVPQAVDLLAKDDKGVLMSRPPTQYSRDTGETSNG